MTTKKPKILIVDDEEDWLQLFEKILEAEGFTVLKAKNGAEAISLARKHLPQCVVADLRIGGESGLDLCRRIKHSPDLGAIPVIILSGMDEDETGSRGECAAFACKADGTNRIVAAVKKALTDSRGMTGREQ